MKRAAAFILVVWIFTEKIDGLADNRSSTKQKIRTSETTKTNETEITSNTTSSIPLPTEKTTKTTKREYEIKPYTEPYTRKYNGYENDWDNSGYDPCSSYIYIFGYPSWLCHCERRTEKSARQYCLDGCAAGKGCDCSLKCKPQSCPKPKTEYKVIYQTKIKTVEVPRKDCPGVEFRHSTIALAILMVIAVVIIIFLAVKACGVEEDDVVVKEGMETETVFDPTTFTFMTIPLRKKEGEEKNQGKRKKTPMTAEEAVMSTLATI